MWEMKKYCLESRSRGISYMKYAKGRLTGMVTVSLSINQLVHLSINQSLYYSITHSIKQ